jgi:hypothetical protein
MAEDFNIGVKKLAITFAQVVSGKFEPITGLNNATIRFIRADTGAVVPYDNWEEVGNGLYQFWNFQIPEITFTAGGADYQGHLNLKVQYYNGSAWITKAETFSIYRNSNQFDGQDDYPPSRAYVDNRVDRQGDTIFNQVQYDASVDLNAIAPLMNDRSLIHRHYADSRYVQGVSTDYVTISSNQTITGQKTFNNIIIDVGNNPVTSAKFIIKQNSNPPNGGIEGLKAGYQSTNKMLFDFLNSHIEAENLKIKTSSSKYITGNPSDNDYVWKRWVVDNFLPIGSTFSEQSNTAIVDKRFTENVARKFYKSINDAIGGLQLVSPPLSQTNWWNLIIQGSYDNTYNEDIELPDWINLIGSGFVNIIGALTRSASTETIITSKISNLNFNENVSTVNSHNLERLWVNNCVFRTADLIGIKSSKLINSGLYADVSINSIGNNKIVNCFGNQLISWQASDVVYSYNYVSGDNF